MSNTPFHDFIDAELTAALEHHGSIRRVAEAVGISQPAASRRLHAIQRRVDTSLFHFSPRGAKLTPAGRFWAIEANAVLQRLEIASDRFDQEFRVGAGRLRVAAGQVVSDYLLPQWLHAWGGEGQADIQVGNSAFVLQAVIDGKAELGLCEIDDVPPELASLSLVCDELVLVVAPSHKLARRKRPLSVATLSRLPLVHREPGSGTQQTLNNLTSAQGYTLAPSEMQVNSLTAIKTAAIRGLAPAVVSKLSVKHELASGQLHQVDIHDVDLKVWVKAVYRRGSHLSRLAQSFLAQLPRRDNKTLPASTQ